MLPADPLFKGGEGKHSIPSWEWEEEGKVTKQLKTGVWKRPLTTAEFLLPLE